jgi:hypothetical protein
VIDGMALDDATNELYQKIAEMNPDDLENPPLLSLDSTVFDLKDVQYVCA